MLTNKQPTTLTASTSTGAAPTTTKSTVPKQIVISKAMKKGETCFHNGDFDGAIMNESLAIEKIQMIAVRAIMFRAASLGKKGRYEEELKDSFLIMTIAPEDPVGYILAGKRYADQGLQRRALEIFSKGLKEVSMSHPDYELLQDGKITAQSKFAHRFDFLSQLPNELVASIMDKLDCETIAESVVVSKTWKKKLADIKVCHTKLAVFRSLQVWIAPLSFHGAIWQSRHEDAVVYYHQVLGLDFGRIAARIGRVDTAVAARYKKIRKEYTAEAFGDRRVPSRLPLRQQQEQEQEQQQ